MNNLIKISSQSQRQFAWENIKILNTSLRWKIIVKTMKLNTWVRKQIFVESYLFSWLFSFFSTILVAQKFVTLGRRRNGKECQELRWNSYVTDENGVTYVIDTMIQVRKSMPDVVVSFFQLVYDTGSWNSLPSL